MKIYDKVKLLLTQYPETKDSDKKLFWRMCFDMGLVFDGKISYVNFLSAPSTESVRRCRQKIQELHPELRGSETVQKAREEKRKSKSTFIYRETVPTRQDISAPVDVMLKLKEEWKRKGL